jgi:RsiW-degrading membrane proteinase PrsW (M82 family)/RNA polymerase subunit RPABC4/transcription elongation factor Spt4
MRCQNCGRELPEGALYCPHCGAHQHATAPAGRTRARAYVAHPGEHLYQPSIITTFFPHLGSRRTIQARWLLLIVAVAIFVVGLARYVPLAIVLAALFVPVLYLLYFYEAQIYEDEPFPVLAATFFAGGVLGLAFSLLTYHPLLNLRHSPLEPASTTYLLATGVAVPVAAQILMLVGPLLLYFWRPRFDEILDGLAFGAASGLGFAATQSLAFSWLNLIGTVPKNGSAVTLALPTIRIALLTPLLNAATTGLICAALWLLRDRRRRAEARLLGPIAALPVAIVLALLGQVVPSLGSDLAGGQVVTLIWYAATLVVMLLLLRRVLQVGLLEKARPIGHGGMVRCPHCHSVVADDAFCPHCGIALRSTSKRQRAALPAGETSSETSGQAGGEAANG